MSVSAIVVEVVAAITGGATLILALVTWRMATYTRRMAEETARSVETSNQLAEAAQLQARVAREQAETAKQQTELTRQSLLATVQPLLVDVPFADAADSGKEYLMLPEWDNTTITIPSRAVVAIFRVNPFGLVFSVPLRNVGSGTAVICRVVLSGPGHLSGVPQLSTVVIPPGQTVRVSFKVPMTMLKESQHVPPSGPVLFPFGVVVLYANVHTDTHSVELWRTTVDVKPSAGDRLRVWQIEVDHGSEGKLLTATYPIPE